MIDLYAYDEKRFLYWLSTLMNPDKFDLVVTVERKATAILRSLLDLSPEIKCNWDWTRVLSSDALPYLPKGYLRGKRILVFNEMIHRGSSTKHTVEAIDKNTPKSDIHIETAAFVVHERFEREECWSSEDIRPGSDAPSPDYAVERNASDRFYAIYRERLITALKVKGSLLLDTEHIESTFTFALPPRRFFEALWTFGEPVQYEDEGIGGFSGVTIRKPAVVDWDRIANTLPKDSDLDLREPQKIRMVRRGPKEFAFIPIWYPPIPESSVLEKGWENAPSYIKPAIDNCPKDSLPALVFHLASLVTGIELIRSVWAGLRPFIGKGVEPETLKGSEEPGSPLGHFRALYPCLDFTSLEAALSSAISGYKDKKLSNVVHKRAGWQGPTMTRRKKARTFVDARTRIEQCLAVLKIIVRRQKRFSIGDDWFEEDVQETRSQNFPPFLWRDIWSAGEEIGLSEALRSIIMDTAIDNAFLKTGHTSVRDKGQSFVIRAYQTDSEFVREALERMVHGAEEVLTHAQ